MATPSETRRASQARLDFRKARTVADMRGDGGMGGCGTTRGRPLDFARDDRADARRSEAGAELGLEPAFGRAGVAETERGCGRAVAEETHAELDARVCGETNGSDEVGLESERAVVARREGEAMQLGAWGEGRRHGHGDGAEGVAQAALLRRRGGIGDDVHQAVERVVR